MNSDRILDLLRTPDVGTEQTRQKLLQMVHGRTFSRLDQLLVLIVGNFRSLEGLPDVCDYEALKIGSDALDAIYPDGSEAAFLDYTPELSPQFVGMVAEQMTLERLRQIQSVKLTRILSARTWTQRLQLVEEIRKKYHHLLSDAFLRTPAYVFVDDLSQLFEQILDTDRLLSAKLPTVWSQGS